MLMLWETCRSRSFSPHRNVSTRSNASADGTHGPGVQLGGFQGWAVVTWAIQAKTRAEVTHEAVLNAVCKQIEGAVIAHARAIGWAVGAQ
jgi:hypothetical protein